MVIDNPRAKPTIMDYLPENPFRPLDWRWQLASAIQKDGLPPRWRRRDAWVRAICKYLRRSEVPRRRLTNSIAAIGKAHGIWSSRDPRQRLELEIRLLSGQTYADVAARCAIPAEIVEAYERLFFNVIDWVEASDYMTMILDPDQSVVYGTPDHETVARVLAHRLGPPVVDHLLAYLGLKPSAGLNPGMDRALRRLLAVLSVPLNETTASGWLRLRAVLSRLESDAKAQSAAPLLVPIVITRELPVDVFNPLVIASTGTVGRKATQEPALDGAPASILQRRPLMAAG
jgi:hypothetical protein